MMRDLRLRYERHFHDSDYETPQARTLKDSKKYKCLNIYPDDDEYSRTAEANQNEEKESYTTILNYA